MAVADWVIGCTISVFSSTILNVGVNLQRWALVCEAKDVELKVRKTERSYIKQPKWWLGFALFVLGNLGDMTALSFASPTILVALGSVSLVSNSLLGVLFLHEPYSRSILFDNGLIITGAVIAILNGSHTAEEYTADEIESNLKSTGFIILLLIYVISFCVLYVISRRITKAHKAGTLSKAQAVFSPLVFCPMTAILATGTTIFGTSFSEMTRTSIESDESQFKSFVVYLILFCLVFCAITQVHFIARALAVCGSLAVVPVQYSFWVVLSIIGSIIFFKDFDPEHLLLFIFGCLLTLSAVALLSYHQYQLQVLAKKTETESSSSKAEEQSDTIDENHIVLIDDESEGAECDNHTKEPKEEEPEEEVENREEEEADVSVQLSDISEQYRNMDKDSQEEELDKKK